MITKEQIVHDLAVTLAGQYVGDALAHETYKDLPVYKAMTDDAASVYKHFRDLLQEVEDL